MKALTISQPFASLIADGSKWIENRCWYTSYRGPLAIHAGKGTQYMTRKELADVPHGCIVATAKLTGCFTLRQIQDMDAMPSKRKNRANFTGKFWSEIARHKHAEGPLCWILENVIALPESVPCKGAQGLWEWKQ